MGVGITGNNVRCLAKEAFCREMYEDLGFGLYIWQVFSPVRLGNHRNGSFLAAFFVAGEGD